MKKLLIGLFVIIIMLTLSVYIFIPAKITVSTVRYVKAYHAAVLKFQTDSQKINSWLQPISNKTENGYEYKGFSYNVNRTISNITEFSIKSDKIDIKSSFISLNVYLDSSAIQWAAEIEAGSNPIVRYSRYREAIRLKESMSNLMDQLKIFLDNSSNMYGILVKETQLKDSILISSKVQTVNYPTVDVIYQQVKKLTDYAASKNAAVANSPMLFVKKLDGTHYEAMIGLPINKNIDQTNEIRIKRMPYNGNVLVTEIKGGTYSIKKSFDQLETYLTDAKRSSPAIPYELMVTDRSKETDTAKWVTRLYYPVM